MTTEKQEFAGWTFDQRGETTRSLLTARIAKGVTGLCVAALILWYVLYRIGILPYEQGMVTALIVVGVSAELIREQVRRGTLSPNLVCNQCRRKLELVETVPAKASEPTADGLIHGASGHAYMLRRVKWLPKPDAYEVRLQWRACRNCKKYISVPDANMIKIGVGEEAIEVQERSYKESADLRARMATRSTHGKMSLKKGEPCDASAAGCRQVRALE